MNKTSTGLIEFMKRKGLTPNGNSKVDVQTCKELKLFPFYICNRRDKVKVLRSSIDALLNSVESCTSFSAIMIMYGFNYHKLMKKNKLIDLNGDIVIYYDFGSFLVLESSNIFAAARMEVDKGIKCYFENHNLSLIDFAYYCNKAP